MFCPLLREKFAVSIIITDYCVSPVLVFFSFCFMYYAILLLWDIHLELLCLHNGLNFYHYIMILSFFFCSRVYFIWCKYSHPWILKWMLHVLSFTIFLLSTYLCHWICHLCIQGIVGLCYFSSTLLISVF